MKIIGLILVLLFSVSLSFGQSLTVFDVNASNFPLMKAKIFVMDANGNQLSNLSPSDFTLKENGQQRNVTNISCPIEKPVQQVSLAMGINALGSRSPAFIDTINKGLSKSSAKSLIKLISSKSDIALESFDTWNHLMRDFTGNKAQILSVLDSGFSFWGDDYAQQLLNPYTGLLNIAKAGKNKRIALMFCDAWGKHLSTNELNYCIDTCRKYDIQFYAVLFSNIQTLPNGVKNDLKKLADETGGLFFDGITNYEAATEVAYLIQQKIQIGEYCEIHWESKIYCENENRFIDVVYKNQTHSNTLYYLPSSKSISKLEIHPSEIHFQNIVKGIKRDTVITITAINEDFIISSITVANSDFTVSPDNLILKAGQSKNIKLSYLPVDEGYSYSQFNFVNETCPANIVVIGGNKKSVPTNQTLRLIYPNGDEFFAIGSKQIIRWEGVSELDTISIDYSLDSGKTWNLITNNATGLKYEWENIKVAESKNCLIKISQFGEDGNPDEGPKIEWAESYGDNQDQYAFSIIKTKDSNYVFTGSANKLIKDINETTYYDILIVKINQKGEKIWSKSYGGSLSDIPVSIIETHDCGFIVSGLTNSTDGIMTGNKEGYNIFILKIDSLGSFDKIKFIGGSSGDYIKSMIKTSDNGFILTGYTNSKDGDVIGYDNELSDCWTVKFDSLENIEWQHTFGKKKHYTGESIIETFDNGFVVVGTSLSQYDSIVGNEFNYDVFVKKLDKFGNSQWLKSFGLSKSSETANSVIETQEGNLIISGTSTDSLNQKVGNLIIKMDSFGNIIWNKIIFIDSIPSFITYDVIELDNKDLLFGGYGYNYRISPCCPNFFMFKTDKFGNLKWNKSIGGSYNDYGFAITKSYDNGFLIAGSSESNDGDIIHPLGGRDAYIIKFSADGITLQEDVSDSTFSIVAPSAESRDVDMGSCLIGNSKDSILTEFIHNTGLYKIRIDSVYFSGEDSSAFSFVPEFSKYEIEAGEFSGCEIQFKPFKTGLHSAQVNIITQSDTLIQNINGTGYQPQLDIVSGFINFGEVELGNYKQIQDSTLIKNISDMPVMINNVLQNDFGNSQFEIVNGDSSFVLQPNEERKISMKFKPLYGGRSTGQLEFNYEGVGSPAIAQLFGIGIGGVISISNDSAYAGENISVKLKMENVKVAGIAALAPNFEATIRFQNTILAPINNANWSISNDSTYLTVKGKIGISQELVQIPLIAGLGNVDETTIDIMNFMLTDESGNQVDYDFEFESGTFKLLGICYEGGARLINPNNKVELLQISPNPNDGNLVVEINLIEDGFSTLSIYNSNGQLMYEQNISGSTGKIDLSIDTKEYSNGLYFVSLQTPTIRKVKQMVVFK